MSLLWGLGSV